MQAWYYGQNDTKHGPYTKEQIVAFVRQGKFNTQTMVWQEGMSDWVPMGSTDLGLFVSQDDAFCAPVPTHNQNIYGAGSAENTPAIFGFSISIMNFFLLFVPYLNFLVLFTWLAVVFFSIAGLAKSKRIMSRRPECQSAGRGLALSALLISLFQMILLVLLVVASGLTSRLG